MKTKTKYSVALPALATVLLLAGWLLLFLACWYRATYGDLGFDSVLYTVFSDLGGVQSGLVISLALKAVLPAMVCTVLFVGFLFRGKRRDGAAFVISLVLTLALAVGGAVTCGMHQYIYDLFHESSIFEEEYVDPDSVEIEFPEENRSSSEWTGWISMQSKGLSRVFSNTTVQKHQEGAQPSSQSNSHIHI